MRRPAEIFAATLVLAFALGAIPDGARADTPLTPPADTTQTLVTEQVPATRTFATGRHDGKTLRGVSIEGQETLRIWRSDQPDNPTERIRSVQDMLTALGFETLYDCVTRDCGGFDFRFAIPTADPPEMEVDIGNYHYISMIRRAPDVADYVSLLSSRAGNSVYVQILLMEAGLVRSGADNARVPALSEALPSATPTTVAAQIVQSGRAVLDGVVFETGSAVLAQGFEAALIDVATLLKAQPDLKIAVVGHTDAQGQLESNLGLSKARAERVVTLLVTEHGIAPDRLIATGAGFLAPRATNKTEDGRAQNRRVEIVVYLE